MSIKYRFVVDHPTAVLTSLMLCLPILFFGLVNLSTLAHYGYGMGWVSMWPVVAIFMMAGFTAEFEKGDGFGTVQYAWYGRRVKTLRYDVARFESNGKYQNLYVQASGMSVATGLQFSQSHVHHYQTQLRF